MPGRPGVNRSLKMFRIFLTTVILLCVPHVFAQSQTWEDFQRQKAAEEESAPIPKSGPKLVPKDVVIEKLKTEGQVTYSSDALLFHFGQSTLKSESMPNLKSMAEALKEASSHPELSRIQRYYVDGHTCSVGSAEFNCRLSWARANAVIDHLEKMGVSKDKLVARGYGLAYPAHSNDSEETRMLNRRVVLKSDPGETEAEKNRTTCAMTTPKPEDKPQKQQSEKSVSPSLEEVAGIKKQPGDRKKNEDFPANPEKEKNAQGLPRGFKRVE